MDDTIKMFYYIDTIKDDLLHMDDTIKMFFITYGRYVLLHMDDTIKMFYYIWTIPLRCFITYGRYH